MIWADSVPACCSRESQLLSAFSTLFAWITLNAWVLPLLPRFPFSWGCSASPPRAGRDCPLLEAPATKVDLLRLRWPLPGAWVNDEA